MRLLLSILHWSDLSSGRADSLAGSPPACKCWVHRVCLVWPCVHRCWQTLLAAAGADSWPASRMLAAGHTPDSHGQMLFK